MISAWSLLVCMPNWSWPSHCTTKAKYHKDMRRMCPFNNRLMMETPWLSGIITNDETSDGLLMYRLPSYIQSQILYTSGPTPCKVKQNCVYISQLFLFARVCSNIDDFNNRSNFLTFLFNSSLIVRWWVGLQTLWRFRLKYISIVVMVGAWCFGCSVLCTVESLSLLYLLFMSWFICSRRCCMDKLGSFMQTKHLCILIHIWTKSEVGAVKPIKPSIYWLFQVFQGSISFVDHLCYLYLVFVMLSRLFIAALWLPAGRRLISWILFVMFNCIFVTFPCGILGQVWYLIVSFSDLCRLSYFSNL